MEVGRKVVKEESKVKPLTKEVRNKLRATTNIVSVAQCVQELIFNSIDAGATKISVGVNLKHFKIEVEDNGCGLSKADLEMVGKRYVTSKCSSEQELGHFNYYGYRGEALSSIISLSNTVKFFTRPQKGGSRAYRRWFRGGKPSESGIEELKDSKRPHGLTVTVEGLLYNQPVRQNRLDRSLQLEDVRMVVEHIALINPNIGLELRNECNMTILLQYHPCFSHADAFDQLYSTKKKDSFSFVSENHLQDGLMFQVSIGKQMYRQKCFQFVFVNKKCIQSRMKIHKVMNDLLFKVLTSENNGKDKSKLDKLFPVFILNIVCALEMYSPQMDSKFSVEFHDWNTCIKGIEGLILKFQRRVFPSSSAANLVVPLSSGSAPTKKYKTLIVAKNVTSVEKSFGQDITTRDVKNAIHSRSVIRESQNSSSQESEKTANTGPSEKLISKLKSKNNKVKERHGDSDSDALSTTYSDLPSSPGVPFKVSSRPVPKPTAKHIVYNVRRSPKKPVDGNQLKRNVAGRPKKDIVVPKKPVPVLNKDIISKFPVWGNKHSLPTAVGSKRQKEVMSMDSSSPPIIAPKKARFNSLVYKQLEKHPVTNNKAPINHLNGERFKDSVAPAAKPIRVLRNNTVDDDEQTGLNWKLRRFLSDAKNHNNNIPSLCLGSDSDSSPSDKSPNSVSLKIRSSAASGARSTLLSEKFKSPDASSHSDSQKNEHINNGDDDAFGRFMIESAAEFVSNKQVFFAADIADSLQKDLKQVRRKNMEKKISNSHNWAKESEHKQSNTIPGPSLFKEPFTIMASPVTAAVVRRPRGFEAVAETPDPYGLNRIMKNEQLKHSVASTIRDDDEPLLSGTSIYFQTPWPTIRKDDAVTFDLPPPCDILPSRKRLADQDWSDRMSFNKTVDDPNVGGSGIDDEEENEWGFWEVDVVSDTKGQDWLQTVDDGKTVFINLSTGDLSYDMVNIVKRKRTTANCLTKANERNWLRRYFPKGRAQLWKPDGSRKPQVNGNIAAVTNHLSDSVKECIVKSVEDPLQVFYKWNADALASAFKPSNDKSLTDTSEYFNVTCISEMPVTSLNGETKTYNKIVSNAMKFKKDDLRKFKVITQWDSKFIIAKLTVDDFDERNEGGKAPKDILVALDQHAVHERIRLEQLINELYEIDKLTGQKRMAGVRIDPSYTLNLTETETRIISSCKEAFNKIALNIAIVSRTVVEISFAPTCILKKALMEQTPADQGVAIKKLLTDLIQEEVHRIMDTKTVTVTAIPKLIFNILCSEACHGAIKFGDQLDIDVCEAMISSLQNCRTPFQCAHGRPSLVPLTEVSSLLRNATSSRSNKPQHRIWKEPHRPSSSSSEITQSKPSIYFLELE